MSRGGARKGAGRKSNWASGCMFSETVTIRIPRTLKNKILDLAHRLDAGEEIDLVSKSIVEENQYLREELDILRSGSGNSQQLELLPNINDLPQKAKDLLYQESLVRPKDRSPVKKVLAALFDVDKKYFDRPRK